jgi:glycosyltransferase involved in cell wall biosynthesis
MSLFSVVIPSFNRVALLSDTLESIFAQRFSDFEIVVVDDGSTDGTVDYLQSLGKEIRVFQQSNRGAGAARNLGAHNAQGKYLAFLDSDDLWFPWTLEVYREVIEECSEPSFIAGKPYLFSGKPQLDQVVPGAIRTDRFVDYLASGDKWRWWGASSFLVRRDAFVAAGGFTEEWVNGEDGDLALRLGTTPCFVQILAPATFAYREHAESVSKDMKRTIADAWFKVRAEEAGSYPGGRARAAERRRILTRNTRPVTLACLKQGLWREAWALYRATFAWNASLRRMKYLALFPILAIGKRAVFATRSLSQRLHEG